MQGRLKIAHLKELEGKMPANFNEKHLRSLDAQIERIIYVR
jgi:hypothetical protein